MITESQIYWITRMDYIQTALFVLGGITTGLAVVGFIISAICCMLNVISGDSEAKRMMSACFVPSTKELCAIKVIPKIVNNEEVQELPNRVVELAGEWLENLKPEKYQEERQDVKTETR